MGVGPVAGINANLQAKLDISNKISYNDDVERFDCVSTENQTRADTLEREICLSSAQAHAAMARVTAAAAEFDEIGGWGAGGIKSFPHWLAIWAGFDSNTGAELLRVGQALRALPLLSAAFAAGELSFDKVRQATSVATPDTDELMTRIARGASGSQLARICRSLRRMVRLEQSENQRAKRGLWRRIEEDGMLRLVAILPPEEGEIVMKAIESISGDKPPAEEQEDAAYEPWPRAGPTPWSRCRSMSSPVGRRRSLRRARLGRWSCTWTSEF